MENLKTQIVVIAGGPSGLSAACQAAEDGADVIVIEKANVAGGAANMGMGPLGIGTRYQQQQMIDVTVEKAFNMFMDYTHYNVDARLVKRYFEQSAETIEWLEEKGVEFEGAFRYFPQSEATWHIVKTGNKIGPRAAGHMNKALLKDAQDRGVNVLLETKGLEIIKDDEGKVCGVRAQNAQGEEFVIECKAAIICTGGAGANKQFIQDEIGLEQGREIYNFAIPGIMGDGLKMAWAAGADHLPVRIEQAADLGGGEEASGNVINVMKQPNLIVNKFGKRIMNEEFSQNTTYLGNVANHQKDKTIYAICDTATAKGYVKNGVDVTSLVTPDPDVSGFFDDFDELVANGSKNFFKADTIEELAGMLGIDAETLEETVDEYNDFCDGRDEEFFKNYRYLKKLRKGPFYAAAIHPGGYGTVGGIRINENCECCDKDFMPIPGLYAAGADACNIYDDSYMFLLPGNSMGFAVNTGRIAGMQAAEYVEE
ncbi:FAD-dependent oxidoreductase [Agathobacter ruminis]|uniref:FAD-binding dehydrogenase n=1 Tax=Agathobacter ruminis TaxID=1712665 RepID=A0A2G3DZ07_9FIRM|nr:FAD-dependent oxidoreductase [Agathobacter ruminis]MDC7302352.1 FAD-dependent oxidoreductase [Agathobacter ruminis]PHU36234.1 FAD-binding dehydrogenase [Agathobacter ruminis]